MTQGKDLYAALGVDADKTQVHQAVRTLDSGLFPGAFCRLSPDIASDPNFVNCHHGDGVGTKVALYYLLWKAGLCGPEVFERAAFDAAAMNFDDIACAGGAGANYSLIDMVSRNSRHIDGEVLKAIIRGFQRVCALTSSTLDTESHSGFWGGETADVADLTRTLDVMCAVFARFPRQRVIDAANIGPGNIIVGFKSDGQATWEDAPNSGIRSNGLTLARHILLHPDYREQFPETADPDLIKSGQAYRGRYKLNDPLPGDERFTVGMALGSPTRLYTPLIRTLTDELHPHITALIHCSGGGATKSRTFGTMPDSQSGLRYVKSGYSHKMPAIFRLLLDAGVSPRELFKAFNAGVGLEAYFTSNDAAMAGIEIAAASGIGADKIGVVGVRDQPGNEVVIGFDGENHAYNNEQP